ncbi:hypothetical protein LAJPDJIK_00835 [Aeromonas salmonicida]
MGKGIITDHGTDGLATELAITSGIYVLVEAGLGDLGGELEIFQQLFLGRMQYLDLDVFTKIGAIHQQLE